MKIDISNKLMLDVYLITKNQHKRCSSFILEGDFELVIKILKSEEDSFSPFDHILASVKATT